MMNRLLQRIFLAGTLAVTGGCIYLLFLYNPKLDWEKTADVLLMRTTVSAQHIDYNYIPDLRIWGNGDAVWVTFSPESKRVVHQGHISEKNILKALKALEDAGYFKLKRFLEKNDEYSCYSSGMGDTFTVNLTEGIFSHSIWTLDEPACAVIHGLENGQGIEGKEFVPIAGKLHVLPIEKTDILRDARAAYQWPDEEFGYDLETFFTERNDQIITGKELALAWEIVNRSDQTGPVVLSHGKKYWIAVLIKGITETWVE